VIVAPSRDGVHVERLTTIHERDVGADSFERSAIVVLPSGGWRLYLSCAIPGTLHWRVVAPLRRYRSPMILTTTPTVEGRTIERYIDVVCAQGVLGVNAFKDVAAGMRNIFGGRSKSYENELGSGVSSVMDQLRTLATELGADAIVGIDIDYESVGSNMLMVSASGTAVKLSSQ
jgi:uncharacterized protein YbjQ (UPF0145 family)